jgi:hypothetical protein
MVLVVAAPFDPSVLYFMLLVFILCCVAVEILLFQ